MLYSVCPSLLSEGKWLILCIQLITFFLKYEACLWQFRWQTFVPMLYNNDYICFYLGCYSTENHWQHAAEHALLHQCWFNIAKIGWLFHFNWWLLCISHWYYLRSGEKNGTIGDCCNTKSVQIFIWNSNIEITLFHDCSLWDEYHLLICIFFLFF